jgi:hypothetical protein
MAERTCPHCNQTKDESMFCALPRRQCKACRKKADANHYANNRENLLKYQRDYSQRTKPRRNEISRKINARLRSQVLQGYGGSCACCGESIQEFLSLDHVFGDGAMDRRMVGTGGQVYRKVIREGFPDTYQLLCFNCNWAKHRGGCPHGNPAGQIRSREEPCTI